MGQACNSGTCGREMYRDQPGTDSPGRPYRYPEFSNSNFMASNNNCSGVTIKGSPSSNGVVWTQTGSPGPGYYATAAAAAAGSRWTLRDRIIADSGNCRVAEIPAASGTQWGTISMTANDTYARSAFFRLPASNGLTRQGRIAKIRRRTVTAIFAVTRVHFSPGPREGPAA